ncbi:L,D-transpeptidase family protein [Sphingomonas sp. AOB5]|uniref:L,D-transpeptidase family protein n=1 Tax=Sphingomonas sp. AOB5 TaxID=3034017 RepID=UPI0023F6AF3C|nr:L,D-transpeptidase family protein [Sphingomonas sp. AOB5]MDF7775714.1 L,D-transpeptidase family protein [Sphingomonas sp. AOB5]
MLDFVRPGGARTPRGRLLSIAALLIGSLVIPASRLDGAAGASLLHQRGASHDLSASVSAESLHRAASGRVRDFYEAVGWRAVWDDASRAALEAALADRSRHGLDLVSFLDRAGEPRGAAEDELAYTEAALRYGDALARGIVDPATLHQIYTLPRVEVDVAAGLAAAIARGDLREWLAALAPRDEEYMRLSRAYLDFRAERQDARPPRIGEGIIRVGGSDSRVPIIVDQLIDDEYLDAPTTPTGAVPESVPVSTLYTREIAEAVERLQRDYGIAADGVVGPNTLAVLNLGPGDRARAIAVALERRRWLQRTAPATRIDVNTAASRLYYYRDGKMIDSRRVIVGKPGTETPALQSPIYRLVANPTWTVPKSIQRGELAHVGRAYLRRHNMTLRNGWIVQGPGPGNALGLVKFDMHNGHAIYLHDTSAPALFARSQRHRSHGCVRVEDALGFARLLAQDQGVEAEWQAAQAGGQQRFVALATPIPVRLLYQNVFIDLQGDLAFRTDPYGWNAPIAKALGFPDRREARVRSDEIDIAP